MREQAFLYRKSMETKVLTKEGYKKLQEELEERRTTIRHGIAQAIKEAKEQGDLSENAEYSEARREQNENENRIGELEAMLKVSIVSNGHGQKGTAQLGSKITVRFQDREMFFTIVGSNEVDPAQGRVSNESPIGRAFIGHSKGDVVTVETPSGGVEYALVEVE